MDKQIAADSREEHSLEKGTTCVLYDADESKEVDRRIRSVWFHSQEPLGETTLLICA